MKNRYLAENVGGLWIKTAITSTLKEALKKTKIDKNTESRHFRLYKRD